MCIMRKTAIACLASLLLCAPLHAQQEQKEKKILRNADIVTMVQNHFDDDTLIKVIQVSSTDFDVSEDALVDLMKQGVSSPVLKAMLASAHKRPASANSVRSAEPSGASSTSPTATVPASQPSSAVSQGTDPNFATREPETPPAKQANAAPAAVSSPQQQQMMPMQNPAMMGINPQQMAMLRAQMASMGMGGMMGSMGMGGMGGFGMNYSPEQLPHVFLKMHPEGKQEIPASTAQIGQTNFNGGMGAGGMALRSLATQGLSFAAMGAGPAGMMAMSAFSMASGFMPGMRPGAPKMTYVWGLPGLKSSRELADKNPLFELTYGNIPGVDPDAYEPVLLKLVQSKDNYRLVGATQMKMTAKNMRNGSGPENGKWIDEERWPCRVNKEERGFYVVRVDAPLQPGEYAVVLRPVKGYKAASSGLGGHAQVFYSVWDFSIPGIASDTAKKKKK
jgi:hypothetical protein